MKQELVKDWMSPNVITITSDAPLPEAKELMTRHKIRRLPVVDNGRLVGIITYGDVRNASPSAATSLSIWELNYLLPRIQIKEIMTRKPLTVYQNTTIGKAAQLMLENLVSGLPVIDAHGKLVGIITESDIFRMVVKEWLEATAEEADPLIAEAEF